MPEDALVAEFTALVHNSMWISTPEYAGWLLKRTSGWLARSPFRNQAWKKKWVSLFGTELLCLDHEPDEGHIQKGDVIRRAVIASNTAVKEDDSDSVVEGHGFCIAFNLDSCPDWHLKAETKEEKANWMVKLSQVHAITAWMNAFEKVRVLGTGAQGTVYELRHFQSGKSFALKEMEITNDKQMKMAISEAQFLKTIVETVSHPNILYIEKVFQVGSKFYLVFPLCVGGELYDAVAARGHYSEHDTAIIVRDLVSALHALHTHNILHLDIKPENILFDKIGPDGKVMLTDFGLSKLLNEEGPPSNSQPNPAAAPPVFDKKLFDYNLESFLRRGELQTEGLRGTFGYMAPEIILLQMYTKAADVFAAGVVLYILLCGYPPFSSKSLRQTLLRTVQGSYKIEGGEWDKVSDEAKDLVQRMLCVDPAERITTAEILEHPWIQSVQITHPVRMGSSDGRAAGEEGIPVPTEGSGQAGQHPPHPPSGFPSLPSVSLTEGGLTSVIRPLSRENLTGSLQRLAETVQTLKTNKMAATVTKFLSQSGHGRGRGRSRLAQKYLVHPHVDARHDSMEAGSVEAVTVLSEEVREAMAVTIFHLFGDSEGRMTVEQLAAARERLGFTPPSSHQGGANIGDLLLLKKMDSDGDGYISAQDMLMAQVQVWQLSDALLYGIFRVYAEAVWYPGKKLNYYHAIQQLQPKHAGLPASSGATSSSSAALTALGGHGAQGSGTATPTGGAPGRAGSPAFPLGPGGGGGETGGAAGGDNKPNAHHVDTDTISPAVLRAAMDEKMNVVVPPKFITEKNVAAIFERLGYDPLNGKKAFEILCETLRHMSPIEETDEDDEHEEAGSGGGGGGGGGLPDREPDSDDDEGVEPPLTPSKAKKPPASATSRLRGAGSSFHTPLRSAARKDRMDVRDFIRAARIDDVLVQVLFQRTNQVMLGMTKRAEARLRDMIATNPAIKEEVALYAIVEDELRAQMQRVTAHLHGK